MNWSSSATPTCACRRIFWPTSSRRCAMIEPVSSIVFTVWPTRQRWPCVGRPSPSTPIFGARCCRPPASSRSTLRSARPCSSAAQALAEIGGFNSLANCLADDYQLGRRIAEKGYRLALCPVVVECWDAPMNWREVWRHQLRWARTIRGLPAPALFFQHPVQRHPLAAAVAGGFADFTGDALPGACRHRLLVDPNLPRPKSSAPVHAGTQFGFAVLAGAGEGFVASGALAGSVYGQHGRMARTTNETSSGRNFNRRTVGPTADIQADPRVGFQNLFNHYPGG